MRTKKPVLLSIITLTTVTIIFWIAYEIYLIFITQPNSVVDPKILEPITPTLDIEVLKDLSERTYFEEGEETNPIITTPEITLTPSPEVAPTEAPVEESLSPSPTGI